MSRNNYNPPPPYGGPAQSSYPAAPPGSSTDPRLPLYYQHHHHYHRYKPSGPTSNSAAVVAIPMHVEPVQHVAADARAVDRFNSAFLLGFLIWLVIVTCTDGMEMLRLAIIGLAGALKAILDHILRELRQGGWNV
ncbi:hypothetical protein M378DRAFT_620522 [Amanita muscaria Koide BX008]|uniref:Uncharacterized protein n=1 Tax=Amanita muscaria (strain Koide BX008) TaxID=946122 RepID=A0A0C2XMM3_AMAMK|nr:hypothetical protein M378DRAFT_620522 [Amanita muscaria Koide BX008]